MSKGHVLDASALLALVLAEPGSEKLLKLLESGRCTMSAVNYAEVVGKLKEVGMADAEIATVLDGLRIRVEPFDHEQALRCGLLRWATRALGLSLGDRACLQLAAANGAVAVTADRTWLRAKTGARVELLR
ncbi:MAG: PIN domain-containing protein [Burkholderiaceae bacterium]